jgi:LysM repeat protein
MPARSSSSARIFAPVALAVCAVAVLIVIAGSSGGGDDSPSGGGSSAETATQQTAGKTTTAERQPATYTVKSGDTLGAIAETTGVPVDTLQELNPELDPQALIAGQKIQLR